MKRLLYILSSFLFLFCSCQNEEWPVGEAVLELQLTRGVAPKPAVSTRAIDADLALTILDEEGEEVVSYAAGTIPARIVLTPGVFTLRAYTENESTWATANGGKGESYYFTEKQIELEPDYTTHATVNVPMQNYAVGLDLPEEFPLFFTSYTFTLKSGARTVVIKQGEKAYFAVSEGGFSYVLSATNTDGHTHATSEVKYQEVEAGKLYTMKYVFDNDASSGGLDIEITDDMGITDEGVDL